MLMADAERKIQQLYNDVNAIYGMLTTIQEKQGSHGERLESLHKSVIGISATQLRHGNRLNELDAAVAGVGEQVKEIRITQMRHENRFTEIDQRFDAQDAKLDAQGDKLDLIMKALNIGAN
jgi:chromosome segregation ATPase